MTFEVDITLRILMKTADVNAAEDLAITLIENAGRDMLDCPAVVSAGVGMSPTNPSAVWVSSNGTRRRFDAKESKWVKV